MAVSNIQTLQKGSTIWAMVRQVKPDATSADVEKVLKANNLTWDAARTLKTGTKINLDAVLPEQKTTAEPAKTTAKTEPAADTDLAQAAKRLFENLPSDILNQKVGDLANGQSSGIPTFWQQLGLSELPVFNAFQLGNFEQKWLKAGSNTPEMRKAWQLANLDPANAKAIVENILQGKY
ncbi:MAG TPA: hypothetical protein V6C99_11425 [Oculatellaceae cyanobacterium]